MPDSPHTLAANSRWNLLAFAFTLAAHFVTVPFVISHIGLPAFGRAGLVLATWAPLVLVGTVLGQAATREIAEKLARADAAGAASVAATAWTLCVATSLALGTVFVPLGPLLLNALMGGGAPAEDLEQLFLIAGCGWAAQQGALVLQGLSAARQDYRTVTQVSAVAALLMIASTLGCTAAWPSATGYLLGVSASFTALLLLWWVASRRTSGGLWPRWSFSQTDAQALFHFGKWQTLAQLAGTVSNQIDRYLLAGIAPAAVVGQYNAANRLQEAAYAGVMKAGDVLFPHFGANTGQVPALQARFFLHATWVVMTFSAAVLAPLIPLADPLLRLWAGPAVADGGALLLQTLVLGGLIGCGSNVVVYYFMGTSQVSLLALTSMVYSVVTIVSSIYLLHTFGPYAAGAGIALASLARVTLSLVLLKRAFAEVMATQHLLIANILPLVASMAVVWVVSTQVPVATLQDWPSIVATYIGLSLAVLLAVTGCTATTVYGRSIFRHLARKRRGLATE